MLIARQQGARFFPLALESFGAFGKRLQAFLLVLDEEANCAGSFSLCGYPVKQYLNRALSFCLQSGNAHVSFEGCRKSRQSLL